MTFYCVAPSCSFTAEAGSQYCAAHNGKKVAWYSVEKPDGTRANVRCQSQEEAERLVLRWEKSTV